jgi:hypothetical protein
MLGMRTWKHAESKDASPAPGSDSQTHWSADPPHRCKVGTSFRPQPRPIQLHLQTHYFLVTVLTSPDILFNSEMPSQTLLIPIPCCWLLAPPWLPPLPPVFSLVQIGSSGNRQKMLPVTSVYYISRPDLLPGPAAIEWRLALLGCAPQSVSICVNNLHHQAITGIKKVVCPFLMTLRMSSMHPNISLPHAKALTNVSYSKPSPHVT